MTDTGPISAPPPNRPATAGADAMLAVVTNALDRLRFGDIRLTVHEGRLVQIDVTERTRLTGN